MKGTKLPGVHCPACGGPSMVYSTRRNALSTAGGLRRRRKCLSCHHRFSTDEEAVPEIPAGTGAAIANGADVARHYLALDREGRAAVRRVIEALLEAKAARELIASLGDPARARPAPQPVAIA